jgi:uncharacterized protein YndB with AHSA1/START domain
MARNEVHVDAAPEDVFAVLADPGAYADWVVGSKEIRDADPQWPQVGSRFHHTVGLGPFNVRDHSEVVGAEPPYRFVMRVKARPLGTAKVELSMVPVSGGTLVEMREEPWDLWSRLLHNPVADIALHTRNVESLRRLKRLAEARRAGAPAAAV